MNANNSDLSGVIQRVLGDPESMQKVIKLVGNFRNETALDEETPDDGEEINGSEEKTEEEKEQRKMGKRETREAEENRIRLLCALQPYLNDERRNKADVMIRILKLLRFTDLNELTSLLGGIFK